MSRMRIIVRRSGAVRAPQSYQESLPASQRYSTMGSDSGAGLTPDTTGRAVPPCASGGVDDQSLGAPPHGFRKRARLSGLGVEMDRFEHGLRGERVRLVVPHLVHEAQAPVLHFEDPRPYGDHVACVQLLHVGDVLVD